MVNNMKIVDTGFLAQTSLGVVTYVFQLHHNFRREKEQWLVASPPQETFLYILGIFVTNLL